MNGMKHNEKEQLAGLGLGFWSPSSHLLGQTKENPKLSLLSSHLWDAPPLAPLPTSSAN